MYVAIAMEVMRHSDATVVASTMFHAFVFIFVLKYLDFRDQIRLMLYALFFCVFFFLFFGLGSYPHLRPVF